MNKWFSERVLLEQAFVKDDKKSVGQVAKEAGLRLTGFTRLKVGQQ
jgi:elongation factor Ts